MNDKQVIALLITILRTALDNEGLTDVVVVQNFQPTQQGTPEARVVYLSKLNPVRYGYPEESLEYNSVNDNFDVTETFWRTPKWQVNARAQQDPNDLTSFTAGDLVEFVADVLQLSSTRETLLASNVGIERITDIRLVRELNDKDRFEETPSFDFTLSYQKSYVSTVAAVDTVDDNINRI